MTVCRWHSPPKVVLGFFILPVIMLVSLSSSVPYYKWPTIFTLGNSYFLLLPLSLSTVRDTSESAKVTLQPRRRSWPAKCHDLRRWRFGLRLAQDGSWGASPRTQLTLRPRRPKTYIIFSSQSLSRDKRRPRSV